KKNIRENNYHVFKVLYIIKIRAFVANILFRVDSLRQKKQNVKTILGRRILQYAVMLIVIKQM
ncbi:MAG: hypothetical protein RIS47_198, partial [Bacteroidota bacterium]